MEQLSNYELLALFTTYGSDSGGHFMNFLAVFSAYLLVAYVLAGKLGRTTLSLLTALYLAVTLMTATGQYFVQIGVVDLANEMINRGASMAPNLVGQVVVFSGNSGKAAALISPLIQLVACAGSIVFAFYQAGNAHQATDT